LWMLAEARAITGDAPAIHVPADLRRVGEPPHR
jgi:hypothetical protein